MDGVFERSSLAYISFARSGPGRCQAVMPAICSREMRNLNRASLYSSQRHKCRNDRALLRSSEPPCRSRSVSRTDIVITASNLRPAANCTTVGDSAYVFDEKHVIGAAKNMRVPKKEAEPIVVGSASTGVSHPTGSLDRITIHSASSVTHHASQQQPLSCCAKRTKDRVLSPLPNVIWGNFSAHSISPPCAALRLAVTRW